MERGRGGKEEGIEEEREGRGKGVELAIMRNSYFRPWTLALYKSFTYLFTCFL